MTLKHILLPGLAFLFSIGLYAQQDSIREKALAGFDLRVEKIVADWKAAGCAVGIVKNGKVIYAKGFGYRDIDKKLPVNSQTLFRIASNTKLFTATAAGFLVNEKQLDWDLPIRKYVPTVEFNTDALNNDVTLRDMLSHRTGLSSPDMIYWGFNYTRKQIFEKLKFVSSDAAFRTTLVYNNVIYIAVGEIIELVSKTPYETYIRKKLLQPLEMNSSVFTVEEMMQSNNFAKPYYSNNTDNKIDSVFYFRNDNAHAPAGGLVSNIDDMNKWLICQLNHGYYKNKEIIPTAIFEETMKPSNIDLDSYPRNLKDKNRFYNLYALGREITNYKGHAMTFHDGGMNGYSSKLVTFPNDSLGIVILTNSNGQHISSFLAFEIADRILNLDRTKWHEDFLERNRAYQAGLKQSAAKPEKPINTACAHKLSDYVGRYDHELYGTIEVKLINKELFLSFGRFLLPLKHKQYETFVTTGNDLIEFDPNFATGRDGNIEQLSMEILGRETIFKKVK